MQRGWTEPSEERAVKHFLDFCFDDVVSSFELGLLIKWFGPIELAFKNLILTLKSGYVGPHTGNQPFLFPSHTLLTSCDSAFSASPALRLLVGAIPATEANTLLKGKLPGSFLVRFSKTRPGCFAVTVGGDSSSPKHFLLNYVEPGKFSMQHSSVVYTSIHNFVQMQSRLKYPVTTRTVCELMADVPLMRTSVEIHSPNNLRESLTLQPRSSSIASLSTSLHLPTPNEIALAARPVYDDGLRPGGRGSLMRASSGNTLVQSQRIAASDSPFTHNHTVVSTPFAAPHSISPRRMPGASPPMGFGVPSSSSFTSHAPLGLGPPQPSASAPLGFGAPKGFGPARPVSSSAIPSSAPELPSSPANNAPFGFAPVHRPTPPITVVTTSSSAPPQPTSASSSPGSARSGFGFGFGPIPSPSVSPTPPSMLNAPPAGFGPPMGFAAPASAGSNVIQRAGAAPRFSFGTLVSQQAMQSFGLVAPTPTVPIQSQQAVSAPVGFGPSASPKNNPPAFGFGPPSSSNAHPVGFGPSGSPSAAPVFGFGPVNSGHSTPVGFGPSNASPQSAYGFAHNSPRSNAAPLSSSPQHMHHIQQSTHRAPANNVNHNSNATFFPSVPEESGSSESSPRSRSSSERRAPSQDFLVASTQSMTTPSSSMASTGASAATAGGNVANGFGTKSGATSASAEPWEEQGEVQVHKDAPLDTCVICLDRDRSTLFLECSHMLCCTACSKLVTHCPICRQYIARVVPVYRS